MNRQNTITIAAMLWIMMMAGLFFSETSSTSAAAMPQPPPEATATRVDPPYTRGSSAVADGAAPEVFPLSETPTTSPEAAPEDETRVIAPYPTYTLTQGLHGFSYGQMAVDISAGQGATILAPINGVITQLYQDDLGNTVLVIENDAYQITLMHGDYSVAIGQHMIIGQPLGTESNHGNTIDRWGNSCRGRDCGYHTHINIFDKRAGTNVNPLSVMQ